jgi:hypothetical protein
MDKKHIYNGEPMEDADIYENRLVCHPKFKKELRHKLCSMDKEYKPIFVTSEEWKAMGILSSLIVNEIYKDKQEAHKSLYQNWWNKILERAEKEHYAYINRITQS